ncbi:MAG TPA: emp24/gp25L/p24 family protein [Methanofastidiosum sp.]|nr:emp24/gp25L/p24 family protein [Methanofastidiosum sp.]
MKNKIIILGLITLIAVASMCTTPGSNQQQTSTSQQTTNTEQQTSSTSGEVLFNEKYTIKNLNYLYNIIPVTKGSIVTLSFESIDDEILDIYLLDSTQLNYTTAYGIANTKKNNRYLKYYSGVQSEFKYTFPEDGAYYFVIHNIHDYQTQFYYSGVLESGEKLQKYQFVTDQGTNVYHSRDGWRSYTTYLQKGETINVYYSVKQNEYRNLFIKIYVLDNNGFTSWKRSPVDYSGKIYFDSTNERDRSFEQFKFTAPEKGYYNFVFWNRDSPEGLRLDFKIYKDMKV